MEICFPDFQAAIKSSKLLFHTQLFYYYLFFIILLLLLLLLLLSVSFVLLPV